MKVILLQDIKGVGRRFDVKDVADGHAINSLIPQGLVRQATEAAVKQVESAKTKLDAERKIHEDLLAKNLSALEGKTIHLSAKASDKGHLFASIHADDIIKQLKEELHVDARAEFLKLPEHIKTVGEHALEVEVQGKKVTFMLVVEAVS